VRISTLTKVLRKECYVRHWVSNAAADFGPDENATFRQKPSARRAGKVQCLGEMPWGMPGDCVQARRCLDDAGRLESQGSRQNRWCSAQSLGAKLSAAKRRIPRNRHAIVGVAWSVRQEIRAAQQGGRIIVLPLGSLFTTTITGLSFRP
jgi:hypothetical protein